MRLRPPWTVGLALIPGRASGPQVRRPPGHPAAVGHRRARSKSSTSATSAPTRAASLARRVQLDHCCRVVARTRHKRALTCRPGRDQTCDLDYKAPDGSAGNEISDPGLRRSVTTSLRVGSFPGKGSQTGTSGSRAGTCTWPPPRIDAYSSLIPATRRESSRTYRKYEVPNHVVTQNDWQPPRRVENPRPKSGRSPVRSRPWPKSWPTLALALASLGTVVAAVVRWSARHRPSPLLPPQHCPPPTAPNRETHRPVKPKLRLLK